MLLRGRVGAGAGVYAGAVACIVAAMPLDDLLRLVETLRARIDAHGDLLGQNETRTRYALIDPLLRALGWDVEDPTQVVPEYSLAANRADYALLRADGKPAVIVEAKRLNRPLADGLDQSIAYCVAHGTPYFCVTDGRLWALYETFRQVAIDQKLVTRFGMADSPADVCLKAMALWRPGVLAGQVRPAEPPVATTITKPQPVDSPSISTTEFPAASFRWDEQPQMSLPAMQAALEKLRAEGKQKSKKAYQSRPIRIISPDGDEIVVSRWTEFVPAIEQWLTSRGRLTEEGKIQFPNEHYSALDTVKNAQKVVHSAHMDPNQFSGSFMVRMNI